MGRYKDSRPSNGTNWWTPTNCRGSSLFVPEHHSFDFYEPRSGTGKLAEPETLARVIPGVPLGATRAALDYVRDLAQGSPTGLLSADTGPSGGFSAVDQRHDPNTALGLSKPTSRSIVPPSDDPTDR
ncbi:hypothetical protein GCM10023319_33450 [Nocardia iowensis]